MTKKGSIIDVAFLLVAVLGLAIFILVVGYIFPQITAGIKTSAIGSNTASVAALDSTDNIVSRFDTVFLIIFIGLAISVLVSSFFIGSSPILIPIYIIALSILMIFAAVVEKVYDAFATNVTFVATAATHPITGYILSHLIMAAIGIGVLSMVLIFAKPGGQNQGGY